MGGKTRRAPPRGFLPFFGTRVFGRDADVAAIVRLVATGERLITLLGPAGIGKTRLAHEAAGRLVRPGGAWFVDLSAATDLAQVVRGLATVLAPGLRPDASNADALRALAARLATLGPVVLVLDNCEQAAPAVVAAVRALLAGTTGLQLIATSRTRLRLSFEQVYRVEPLAIDGDAALALIQDRLALRGHARRRGVAELAALRAIVARLEGVPLAIELAAARLDVVSPATLLAGLEAQLDELADDAVDRDPRQRSLRHAIAASWALLAERERIALARLSVFRGGWTAAAARAVVGFDDVDALLHDFVDRSLVRRTADGGEPRYAMFEGLRQYAAEVLARTAERRVAERRHAEHLIAETAAVADWSLTLDETRKRAAEAERENLGAAFDHLVASPDPDAADGALIVASVLASIELTHGPWDVAVERLGRALASGRGRGDLVADALCKRAYLLEHLGRFAEARADLERGIAAAGKAGATRIELDLLRTRVHLDVREGRGAEAIALARRATTVAERLGDASERSLACWGLGLALHAAGEVDEALATIDRGLEIEEREVRAPRPAIYLALRGGILHELGRLDEAIAAYDEAIALVRARNAPTYVAQFELSRALIVVERGDPGADGALAAAGELARATGDDRTGFVAAVAGALALAARGEAPAAQRALAALRGGRDRLGAEARAFHDRVAQVVRALAGRADRLARLEAVLVGDDGPSSLLRFVRRVVGGLLRAAPPVAPRRNGTTAGAGLAVSSDCSLVELSDGTRIELGTRAPARRILRGLVTRHLRAPGEPLGLAELTAEGWPGERIEARAAKNRVHVALAELRRAGLRDVVLRSPRGYFLDPAAHVTVRDADTA